MSLFLPYVLMYGGIALLVILLAAICIISVIKDKDDGHRPTIGGLNFIWILAGLIILLCMLF